MFDILQYCKLLNCDRQNEFPFKQLMLKLEAEWGARGRGGCGACLGPCSQLTCPQILNQMPCSSSFVGIPALVVCNGSCRGMVCAETSTPSVPTRHLMKEDKKGKRRDNEAQTSCSSVFFGGSKNLLSTFHLFTT